MPASLTDKYGTPQISSRRSLAVVALLTAAVGSSADHARSPRLLIVFCRRYEHYHAASPPLRFARYNIYMVYLQVLRILLSSAWRQQQGTRRRSTAHEYHAAKSAYVLVQPAAV